ncbi:MAG: hypothetical protein JXA68_01665 [Ignavibacteriales bacterium]|nr:hypothetical protein [Ignavibacteriales bacterium]
MSDNIFQIKKVETKKDLNKFINFAWEIYKNNQYWVPPMLMEVKRRLNKDKNPFFKHSEMEMFVAVKEKKVIGRIAAIVNHRYNEFHNEKTGNFGMFECINDVEVANALFSEAEKWLKEKGMDKILGPVNLSMNEECAFLLEGFDSPPTILMPYTHKYYIELTEKCGYKKSKDLHAYLKDNVGVESRISKLVERVRTNENVTIRKFNKKRFNQDVALFKEIYNAAWELNWGFVPMTEDEIDYMVKDLKPIYIPDLFLFAEVNGEPVGLSMTLPDINFVIKKINGKLFPFGWLKFLLYRRKMSGVRAIVFGLKKDYRRTGINTVLYYETEKAGVRLGFKWCEMSWNLEDNDLINRFDEAVGGRLYKKYRIVEKPL